MGALNTPERLSSALGAAPSYSARAWVNFNGTGTIVIRQSGNVSSLTDNGAADYSINFETDFDDTEYMLAGSAKLDSSGNATPIFCGIGLARFTNAQTVSSCRIHCGYPAGGGGTAGVDHILCCAAFFR